MIYKLDGIPILAWNGHQREVLLNDTLSDDLNIVSALKYAFAYQQVGLSKVEIAGLTGAAFYIGWNTEHLSSGMGGSVFLFPHRKDESLFQRRNYCGFETLFNYLGMEYTLLRCNDPRIWGKVIDSLNNNIPPVAVEWNPVSRRGHAAILCGYETGGQVFLGRTYGDQASEELTEIVPKNLHYVLLYTSPTQPKGSVDRKFTYLESLENALNILEGATFQDKEAWDLGVRAYIRQCALIQEQMLTHESNYKLQEHFLFWRLQILYICRTYALFYTKLLLEEKDLDAYRESLHAIEACYGKFLMTFDEALEIHNDVESIMAGKPLFWKRNNADCYIQEVFSTEYGKAQFCEWLQELHAIDSHVMDLLKDVATISNP